MRAEDLEETVPERGPRARREERLVLHEVRRAASAAVPPRRSSWRRGLWYTDVEYQRVAAERELRAAPGVQDICKLYIERGWITPAPNERKGVIAA